MQTQPRDKSIPIKITRPIDSFFALLLLSLFACTSVLADTQKFIYIFDANGAQLTPINAADQYPNAITGDLDNSCLGVRVSNKGKYEIELASDITQKRKEVEHGLKDANLEEIDDDEQEVLVELATLALENPSNTAALNTITKNITQGLVNPELFKETTGRILAQVAEIITGAPL